jgi:hypothetical protein
LLRRARTGGHAEEVHQGRRRGGPIQCDCLEARFGLDDQPTPLIFFTGFERDLFLKGARSLADCTKSNTMEIYPFEDA